ncbi:unnamed protein product [Psylliodes chrysocephalus]|uniref:Uncharacterized protein n=1 Tax=Psylliodes chrysocephalus TaxID=3402493 RepID=A0A9P0D6Z1_9CUCU|nr:unnamed protein product [Psylliodes chrysocephala]
MATAGEDLQEALIIKETLKDLKEDILSKFDEIIEISSKQIEEINELVKKNVEEVINKHGPAAEKLVQEMCAEACAQVKQLQLDTEETLTTVWSTSSTLLQSVGKTATDMVPTEDFDTFVESLILFMENVLSGLLDHLSLMVILFLQEQEELFKKFKERYNTEAQTRKSK